MVAPGFELPVMSLLRVGTQEDYFTSALRLAASCCDPPPFFRRPPFPIGHLSATWRRNFFLFLIL